MNDNIEYDCFLSLLYEKENKRENRRIYRENMKRDKAKRLVKKAAH